MIKTSTHSTFTATPQKKKKKSAAPDELFEPSDAVIANLLNFSKALSVKKSRSVGFVENVLN